MKKRCLAGIICFFFLCPVGRGCCASVGVYDAVIQQVLQMNMGEENFSALQAVVVHLSGEYAGDYLVFTNSSGQISAVLQLVPDWRDILAQMFLALSSDVDEEVPPDIPPVVDDPPIVDQVRALLSGSGGARIYHPAAAQLEVSEVLSLSDEASDGLKDSFFLDTDPESEFALVAAELHRLGVLDGFPDGNFYPDWPVNRAEVLKSIYRVKSTVLPTVGESSFPDLEADAWYLPYVSHYAQRRVVQGYPDGSFRPESPVNRAEFLKMFVRGLSLPQNISYAYRDVSSSDWFAPYVGAAEYWALLPESSTSLLDPARTLTRGEMALALYRYLFVENIVYKQDRELENTSLLTELAP